MKFQCNLFEGTTPNRSAVPTTRQAVWDSLEVLYRAYHAGLLGGTVHEVFPNVPESSRERRLYFTLSPSLNYQRKSEGLWLAAFRTYHDPATSFVFEPASVTRGEEEYRQALAKHGLAIQRDKQTGIWYRLAQTLHESFEDDPDNLFSYCGYNVENIKGFVVGHKKDFPYISGPKLLNYWLYMITCFTDVKFVRREAISIVPDVHVRRATGVLGLVREEDLGDPVRVASVWHEVLGGSDFVPIDLHAPLWRWSRAGFPDIQELRLRLD